MTSLYGYMYISYVKDVINKRVTVFSTLMKNSYQL